MTEQTPEPQRPTSNEDRDGWRAYWMGQGMPWRTEPEISQERQAYLAERRTVKADIKQGIYPFRDGEGSVEMTRADVEWLLATHRNGRGPIDWNDGAQRSQSGIDLRGARLSGVDLTALPLARTQAGLNTAERHGISTEQRDFAAIHLEGATLFEAHFEGALLRAARFDGANLRRARFDNAILYAACFSGANLRAAHFEGALLIDSHLEGRVVSEAEVIRLRKWVPTFPTTLPPAYLRRAYFDAGTDLHGVVLGSKDLGWVSVVDVRWQGVVLPVLPFERMDELGDERSARSKVTTMGTKKTELEKLRDLRRAVRAYTQLASALRSQGTSETADRFAYQAQLLYRRVRVRQRRFLSALGSWLLDLISGYGYKPLRSLIAYVLIICLFAGAYLLNAQFAAPHLTWDESLVLSISSFHGRGFFTSGISLGDTLARLAAGEAIIGLLIEITFIATFTQRFFAR